MVLSVKSHQTTLIVVYVAERYVHLHCEFNRPSFPILKIINTPDFSVSSCLNSLEGEKDFFWCLNLPRGYISSFPGCTEDFQTCLDLLTQRGFATCSCLRSLTARRTFSDASTCPGVTSPPPLDALRTCNLFLPKLTWEWEGLSLVPQLAHGLHLLFPWMHWGLVKLPRFGYAKRSWNLLLPVLARGEEGFLISSRLHSLTARRTF